MTWRFRQLEPEGARDLDQAISLVAEPTWSLREKLGGNGKIPFKVSYFPGFQPKSSIALTNFPLSLYHLFRAYSRAFVPSKAVAPNWQTPHHNKHCFHLGAQKLEQTRGKHGDAQDRPAIQGFPAQPRTRNSVG